MSKMLKAKKVIAVFVICSGLIGARTAEAFVWPCIDITQISSFISSITTGLTTISNSVSQFKNIQQTVASLGSQISSLKDFMSDLRQTITSVKESISKVTTAVKDAITNIEDTLKKIEDTIDNLLDQENTIAQTLTDNVEKGVENSESEEYYQSALDAAREESLANKNEIDELYKEAEDNINQIMDDAKDSVGKLVEAVNTNQNIIEKEKEALLAEADKIKSDIEELRQNANLALGEARRDLNEEYNKKVIQAYDTYALVLSEYIAGNVSKEELIEAGSVLQASVASLDIKFNKVLVDSLIEEANKIAAKIDDLEESMLNTLSNDKEYSDEASIEHLNPNVYAFEYKTSKNMSYAKALYSQTATGKPFIISKEFLCHGKGENDVKKLKDDSGWFRTCVSRAKTELDYYPDAAHDSLYENYDRNGVFNHILQDYAAANIVSISKTKQFVSTWRGSIGNETESEYHQLKKLVSEAKVDNAAAAMATISTIELWSPRLWSELRRLDSISNAKNVVKQFTQEETLYIDGREENQDVTDALHSEVGMIKGEGPKDKKVFSNVMLHTCGLKAEDISLKPEETDPSSQENKFKECIKKYAYGVSLGGEEGSTGSEEDRKLWRDKQKMATNDAAFENLTMAVITNYNSTRDYMPVDKLENGEVNLVKIQEVYASSQDARQHIAASAQINYYATQQLLNIIDGEAVNLQAEILKDLGLFDYSFFPKD
ncbi:MAG: hypothetical protein IKW58_02815 [Alphaproteobacteria bacterium]|nr:hypothetical protein [Alphaproteobacteria bacterium]